MVPTRIASRAAAAALFAFAASASGATPPTVKTLAASGVTASGATLNAQVSANGTRTTPALEIGKTTSYGTTLAATPSVVRTAMGTVAVTASASGLTCATTYHYRARATNHSGTTLGADATFTTTACAAPPPSAPTATSGAASAVGASQATLNGTATAGSASAAVTFEYGTTTSYGASVAATPANLAAGAGPTAITAGVQGLACATPYHFRARAQSSAGTGVGADQSFVTSACGGGTAGVWPWPTWTAGPIAVPPSTTGITYYVDASAGNDANTGKAPATAFKTVRKAITLIAAGDTVLIRKGLYREGIDLSSAPSGTAAKPITFGSYGDGEVILDGSTAVKGWTPVAGTVWKAQASFKPIAVVVNDVPLIQVREGQNGSTAPQDGLAGVTNGSGKWYVSSANLITADLGSTIGSGDPNLADIVVPNSDGAQQHVYWWDAHYVTFKGLTIRGSGSNGLWGYGSHVTIDHCDIKFNGKAAVGYFASSGIENSDNAIVYSHVYQNVLVNWPRGNNGYMEAGGSWPGTVVWESNLRPLARGNIVHKNGGEGLLSYGTTSGLTSGSALFEQNVAYDNWSVNLYFDNQPNDVARQNFLFNHPPNAADYLYVGAYPYNSPGKLSVCIMLADEQWSSDAINGYANLRGTQVYDNVMAGCRIGIRDYSEGSQAAANHGLKDTTIVNNTIIMAYAPIANAQTYGIYLQDNKTPSGTQRNSNSLIQDNVVYGFNADAVLFTELPGAQGGLNLDFNLYYSAAAKPFGAGFNTVTFYDFTGWKAVTPGSDTHSGFRDPLFNGLTEFRTAGTAAWDYSRADVAPGSPAIGSGTPQAYSPAVNFRGVARSGWNIGAF